MRTPDPDPAVLAPAQGRRVWLRVGTLIDGTDAVPLRDAHLVYDASTIQYVGERPPPRSVLEDGRENPDLELPDFTLLPGLIDSHVHLFLDGSDLDLNSRKVHLRRSPEVLLSKAKAGLGELLAHGVVAVRDAGDRHGVGLALSRLYQSPARPPMAYVDSPGAAIHRSGRYGGFMGEPVEGHVSPEACVAARVAAGADRIKIIATDIIDFAAGQVLRNPLFTTEEMKAFTRAARSHDVQTFAHASGPDGIERTIEGGVDSVEHGFFVRDDQLARMRDRDIAWVPTFAPVRAQYDLASVIGWDAKSRGNLKRILDDHARSLINAHDMGVRIIAGSDSGSMGVPHGSGLLDEMILMEKSGLPALAVIRSATGTPSARLGFTEPFGRVQTQFRSRFLLTRHSPLDSVENLRKEMYVLFDESAFHVAGSGSSGRLRQ